MTTEASQYRILGITDSVTSCDCCGKTGLVKTVVIEDSETGNMGHYGTTCAMNPAKCFGFSKSEMAKAINRFKAEQQAIWLAARRLYISLGGQMIAYDFRSTGGDVGNKVADMAFYNVCIEKVRAAR